MKKVGFVGLGAMGLPMAGNLAAAGFAVRGYDVRQDAVVALTRVGGAAAQSATDTATGADALVLMVVNAAQAEDILFAGGALAALPNGGIVILMATCPPQTVERIAARVVEAGRRFVDAPVSGGTAGAKGATLSVMAAAPAATFAAARPILDAFGDKVFHVGEKPGQGAMVKTVNQLLCGVHLAAAAEALSLAGKVGVDPKIMLQIVGNSAASSWMLRDRGLRMLEPDPEVTSTIDILVKDLGIVLDAGRETRAALPLAAAAHQMFLSVSGLGRGAADDSRIIDGYRQLNGSPANDR